MPSLSRKLCGDDSPDNYVQAERPMTFCVGDDRLSTPPESPIRKVMTTVTGLLSRKLVGDDDRPDFPSEDNGGLPNSVQTSAPDRPIEQKLGLETYDEQCAPVPSFTQPVAEFEENTIPNQDMETGERSKCCIL
mmetsp:Transcript_78927/g.156338  ORF Transcript_78927/g.156338 Transcript_78927/m.156338 type:complete len:134 (-) Transcript_78927:111-512(-)